MPGNFEKQVQEKLDEMRLSPSAPVWNNIQQAIRQKKDRRKIFFWCILTSIILIGWSLYFILDKKKLHYHENDLNNDLAIQSKKVQTDQKKSEQQFTSSDSIKYLTNNETNIDGKFKEEGNQTAFLQKDIPRGNETGSEKLSTLKNSKTHKAPVNSSHKIILPNIDEADVSNLTTDSTRQHDTLKQTAAISEIIQTKEPPLKRNDSLIDKKNSSSVSMEPNTNKWKLGFQIGTGISGIAKGNGPVDDLSTQTTGNPPPLFKPVIRSGISVQAGITVSKNINDRLTFSTGISYSLFTSRVNAGTGIPTDTVASNGSQRTRVNKYFPLVASPGHTNQYHFISVPVSAGYQLLNNKPLFLHAELSLNRLINSKQLIFDDQLNIYFQNKNSIRKTEVFGALSLSYRLISGKKLDVSFGPKINYSITPLYRSGNNDHLFSGTLNFFVTPKKNN